VVTNPPYGRRIQGGRDLRNLYAQLGHVLRQRCPGWDITLLCGERLLLGQIGLPLESRLHFNNGGLSVLVARGRVQPSDSPSL
jgi:putative N6-adenine-specific DNA methylase